jgi:hypothetical protein
MFPISKPMKKLIDQIQKQGHSELKAQTAILKIYQWLEKSYPMQEATSRARLIRRCLKEITFEERGQRSK